MRERYTERNKEIESENEKKQKEEKEWLRYSSVLILSVLGMSLKDLFRENFYSTIRFYTLRTSKIN